MKHCKKGPEPQELQDYRAQNPSATWDDFRNENRDAYRDVVETLITEQRGLCAYCENSLSEMDKMVEHFHPKSDKYSLIIRFALFGTENGFCLLMFLE
ncbi:MAG: hypothetical protein ABFS56_22975 [Pseudomonadota bacterium]